MRNRLTSTGSPEHPQRFRSAAPLSVRAGKKRQARLLRALGLAAWTSFAANAKNSNRVAGQRAPCSGRSARIRPERETIGWRDVLAPALRDDDAVLLWMFDGRLRQLLRPGTIVIAETYPAECYGWFLAESLKGKGKVEVRRKAGRDLLKWADTGCVELDPALSRTIAQGFPEGDDAFDAVIGLFGMIEVAVGKREPGEPTKKIVQNVEGWILGQHESVY